MKYRPAHLAAPPRPGHTRPRPGADPGQARRADVRRFQQVALHRRAAAPAQETRFGATFFITEGFDFPTNKERLHDLGRDRPASPGRLRDRQPHARPPGRDGEDARDLPAQLAAINAQCQKHGIPQPTSFAYPGNAIDQGRPAGPARTTASSSRAAAARRSSPTRRAAASPTSRGWITRCSSPRPATPAPAGRSNDDDGTLLHGERRFRRLG